MPATPLDPEFVEQLTRALKQVAHHDVGPISGDRPIAELGLDSVVVAELLILLEEQFDIALEQSDIDQVKTLADLQAAVHRALAARAVTASTTETATP